MKRWIVAVAQTAGLVVVAVGAAGVDATLARLRGTR